METAQTLSISTGPGGQPSSNKKMHRSWAMYDWANSAYNLVITSTIFPAYYEAITTLRDDKTHAITNEQVVFFGHSIKNSALFEYTVAASYLIIAFLSPILSSIADYKGNKKSFMKLFTYVGALACCGLYFFEHNATTSTINQSMIFFGLAAVGYCGGLVFYNAYLPEIAAPADRDRVSAQGFAYGYIGSVLLQVVCLVFVLKPSLFGITDPFFPPRLSFLLVGIWWMVWAQIPFARLPKGVPAQVKTTGNIISNGFGELKKVWQQLKHLPVLKSYLGAFFFYSMGVQTVMLAAALFGKKEIHKADGQPLGSSELITTILIIQLVAIAGAYIMAKLSERFGNLKVLMAVVLVWIAVCVVAYYTHTEMQFYLLAVAVGLIMGGIQSLSRSTYAKLMPVTYDTASFFSFYDVTEKLGIVIGMFSFGFIDSRMDMRHSILALIIYFAIGACLLFITLRKFKMQSPTK